MTSIARAAESRRADRLFTDPIGEALAALLPSDVTEPIVLAAADPVTPEAEDGQETPTVRTLARLMPGRTRYFDMKVLQAHAAGCSQVVILAAGLDSRAYRLPWDSGTKVFMLDTAEVTAFRTSVAEAARLGPAAGAVNVVADLSGDWPDPLLAAGFDQALDTVWVAEGILGYLTIGQAERLVSEAARLSGPGSWFLTQYTDAKAEAVFAAQREQGDDQVRSVARERSRSGLAAIPPGAWLPRNGWEPETTTLSAWTRQFGRETPAPLDEGSGGGLMWLIAAERSHA
ncbi:MAG: SAM-dependent methyltransferase [Trebonia sp.]